jgi:hypothetical protein
VQTGFLSGDTRERDHLENLRAHGRIILKRLFTEDNGVRSMDWIDLAQNRDGWRVLVHGIINLRVPQNAENFLIN